jgi:redox-sensitive bicupin YhaK (pirin superfamily)
MVIPWNPHYNSLLYQLTGMNLIGSAQHPLPAHHVAVFDKGDYLVITAAQNQPREDGDTGKSEFLLLGGLPIREPVVQYGPFVMNTKDEIQQAFRDYESGKLGVIPASY